jgi:hypothetical protein
LFHFNAIRLVIVEVGDVVADVGCIVGIVESADGRLCHVLRHEVVACLDWRLRWLLHRSWWIDKNLIGFRWWLVGWAVDEIRCVTGRNFRWLVGNMSKVIVDAGSGDDFSLMRDATSLKVIDNTMEILFN